MMWLCALDVHICVCVCVCGGGGGMEPIKLNKDL